MKNALNCLRNFSLLLFFFSSQSTDLQANTIYVNANLTTGNNDGSSWQNAFTNLQDALNLAANGDVVWVAKGTYYPTQDGNRSTYFRLLKGVKWYGGFDGSETSIYERNLDLNETILSGDIGILGDSSDNSYSVVFTIFSDSTTVMDGFFIEYGNADNPDNNLPFYHREKCGGGLYIHGQGNAKSASPIIRNCTFRYNNVILNGGGIFSNGRFDGTSAPIIENCQFIENQAGNGGGIYQDGGSLIDWPTQIIDCVFRENIGNTEAGAIFFQNTHSAHIQIVQNCIFEKNTSVGGGALLINDFTDLGITFSDCHFIENNAESTGGVLYSESYSQGGGFHFLNCVFDNNKTAFFGGDDSAILLMVGPPSSVPIYSTDFILFDNCQFFNHDINCVLAFGMNLTIQNSYFEDNYQCILTAGRSHTEFHNTHFKENGTGMRVLSDLEVNNEKLDHLISNCIFENNSGYDFTFEGSKLKTISSTFIKNSDYYFVNAPRSTTSYLDFFNSIFWRPSATNPVTKIKYGQPVFGNCLLDVANCSEVNDSDGVINPPLCLAETIFGQDPLFNPDLTLQSCSPAINAGENFYTTQFGISDDYAGNPRVLDGTIDMGAFENELILEDIIVETETQIACSGLNNGSIEISLLNACLPIKINGVSYDTSTVSFENLSPGDVEFIIEDALSRTDTLTVEIAEEDFPWTVNFETQNFDCATGTPGSIMSIPFGIDSLDYSWSNGATTPNLDNLPPGIYDLTATNENNCKISVSVEVSIQNNLPLGINVTPINCHDSNDGVATVTPIIGLTPFSYLWETGETSPTITNLSGGNYSVTVSDVLGCSDELSFTMNAPDSLELNFEIVDVSCFGEDDGSAIVSATGGTVPYTFKWDNLSQNDTLTNLKVGNYTVTVTDKNECEVIETITISKSPSLEFETNFEPISCFGEEDGWISITPTNGTPPYFYNWSNGVMDSLNFNLSEGNYEVTISDMSDCMIETSVFISAPEPINIDSFSVTHISPPDNEFGYLSIDSISGGNPPFTFLWSTGATTPAIDSLEGGTYFVTLTDENGCSFTADYLIDISISSSKNQFKKLSASLYPNPVKRGENINITLKETPSKNWNISVFDAAGKVLLKTINTTSSFDIQAPNQAGVYWILIENEKEGQGYLKFVVF